MSHEHKGHLRSLICLRPSGLLKAFYLLSHGQLLSVIYITRYISIYHAKKTINDITDSNLR